MVVETRSIVKSLGANLVDELIYEIVVPDGEVIKILEIAFKCVADGKIFGYLDEARVDEIEGALNWDANHRVIVNRELTAGHKYKVTANSVTAGDFGVLLVYDRVKV